MSPYFSRQKIERAIAERNADRIIAERNPLREGTLLNGTRASGLFDQEVSPIDVDAALAVLPYRPPFRPRLILDEEDESISLSLTRGLQTGKDRWAQVWLASVHIPRTTEHPQVVVKLLQEAFFPHPGDDIDDDDYVTEGASLHTPIGICRNEAWAFTQLRPLQGLLLPHSYGFYHLELPCGQNVIGHVMEYVEGHALKRDYQGMIDGSFYSAERRSESRAAVVQLAFNVYCLHLCDVHHGDVSPNNVLQIPGKLPFFVFLDFARASAYSDIMFGTMDGCGLWTCSEELELGETFCPWMEDALVKHEPWALSILGDLSLTRQLKHTIPGAERDYEAQAMRLKKSQDEKGQNEVH
ncbi:hypothetical protein DACRYDRAFT_118878 [Dacryopinax primogenitus]|uniref:Protein kinase domain-containing protein n=1 Tax=Dacryopinax primogenitus (strain DJM 731) TaxID=1858805 RepID=M5FR77_DACPD|nr:uncharacterized protein DACRYDRAFT_118878 [Dacryopinax primogenitus]EJT98123.1 hypothetical protein DACRYDRAFT_118878 [Dacryopinax primogenitus]